MVTAFTIHKAPAAASPASQQLWLRKVGLVVSSGPGSPGIDLSSMKIEFRVYQADLQQTPNYAVIRVFNLSDDTAKSVQNEFTAVHLDAGYEGGPYGVIFDGTIKMVRRGRVSPTDTYLDILAADADVARNFAIMNESLAAGATQQQQFDRIASAMGLPDGYVADMTPAAASRGKVLFGMARRRLDNLAATQNATWSVQNGKIQFIPLQSYAPGDAVVISANSGMVGLPQQTEDGILVRILLNPLIKIGTLLQINNRSIQRAFLGGQNLFAQGRLEQLPGLLPKVTDDGFYRVYVVEYEGDNRGQSWYADITCLAVDRSAPAASAVQADG